MSKYSQHALASLVASLTLTACGGGGGEGGDGGGASIDLSPAPQAQLAHHLSCSGNRCDLRLYQIMVEAFIDGDAAHNYNTGYGTSHHKGDLQGIINSLDYIKSVGVNSIWLTPIFESAAKPGQDDWANRLDATGYFASNFFKVDPKFGTEAQLKTLVDEAHKRGMYVFLDGVFGHYKDNIVAAPSGLKPKNGSCTNEKGESYSPGPNQACADFSAPETKAFFKEVATYWITNYKIDGWRLDQAYQVPVDQWSWLRGWIKYASSQVTYKDHQNRDVNPLGYTVAEVWSDESAIASKAYGSNTLPALESAFDFPSRYRVVQTLATEEWGMTNSKNNLPATNLKGGFDAFAAYPSHAMPNLMLGNHDLVRFGDLIQRAGLGNPDQPVYWNRHKAALSFLAAYSGPITLYYGDEIGQELANYAAKVETNCAVQGVCDDHVARTSGIVEGVPTTVGAPATTLNADQADLKAYVAKLMTLRGENPALSVGTRTHLVSDNDLYIDKKESGSNRVLYVLNAKTGNRSVTIQSSDVGNATLLTDLISNTTISAVNGAFTVDAPALTARFLKY